MTDQQRNKLFHKAISMEIIKQQIQVTLTKTELSSVINEALQDESTGASIKRILSPFLANAFPQFPEHTQVSLGATNDDGTTIVSLRKPQVRTASQSESEPAAEEVESSDDA